MPMATAILPTATPATVIQPMAMAAMAAATTGQSTAPPTMAVTGQYIVPPSTEVIGSPGGLRSTALVGADAESSGASSSQSNRNGPALTQRSPLVLRRMR